MINPRIGPKDRNIIRGAIRRAFSRSDLHRRVLEKAAVEHSDPNRPRCKKWVRCAICLIANPKWSSDVDHIDPVIPANKTFNDMTLDEFVDRCYCDESNLQVLCESCHNWKTNKEKQLKKEFKNSIKPLTVKTKKSYSKKVSKKRKRTKR